MARTWTRDYGEIGGVALPTANLAPIALGYSLTPNDTDTSVLRVLLDVRMTIGFYPESITLPPHGPWWSYFMPLVYVSVQADFTPPDVDPLSEDDRIIATAVLTPTYTHTTSPDYESLTVQYTCPMIESKAQRKAAGPGGTSFVVAWMACANPSGILGTGELANPDVLVQYYQRTLWGAPA
jgi:hypothetical protein